VSRATEPINSQKSMLTIVWFRQDLRVSDNPALTHACKNGKILPVYIRDAANAGSFDLGDASKVWLHHSLVALEEDLGGKLGIYSGDPHTILENLMKETGANSVVWNRQYEPWAQARDTKIKKRLSENGISVESFNGSLLWEPWSNLKEDGTPYKVFTPFYRKGCMNAPEPRSPLPKPKNLDIEEKNAKSLIIDNLNLIPQIRWDQDLIKNWNIGERGAKLRLKEFLKFGIKNYKEGRNLPAQQFVSGLSPHLHFGEISPNQVWHAARKLDVDANVDHFCSELGWREFSHSLLHHNPSLPTENLNKKFDHFPWGTDKKKLIAWQKGQTGIPFVDAGMRELWQTGSMHNRVRMVVASFLVKNLLLDWRHGERWFWDTLFDADLANNSASWQWVAGCGADAAPYFRIFNPVTQGQKFDPEGEYVRKYIPEIANLPDKFLFNPWDAPAEILDKAQLKLGDTYPNPIVSLSASRMSALRAFETLQGKN
jgi:deoxyribodipyrimidine photo-lyase